MRRVGLVVFAAALVAGVALTAALSLSGGFSRAADRADLPDLIVRFADEERAAVEARLGALPNVEERSYRYEVRRVPLAANGRSSERGVVHLVEGGRRGYAVVAGRDARNRREAVVERGVAEAWDLEPGDRLLLAGDVPFRVVGIGLSPDNVAFPLAGAPRIYVALDGVPARFRPVERNVALAWLADPAREDVTLTQARAVSFGLDDLSFVTRAGVGVLVGQAAGIVVALLVAFSLVAVGAAVVMLGASARSEVARRLPVIGVERALGFSRGRIARGHAARGALVAAPAAALGLALGWLAVRGPSGQLLLALNEIDRGAALAAWLAGAWLVIVALVGAASAWPAWRATSGPVAGLLRGGELAQEPRRLWRRRPGRASGFDPRPGGFGSLGARLATTRRGRWLTTVVVLGVAIATVVLLLALASLLLALRDDPTTVGKRYTLTAQQGTASLREVRDVPGVADAARRWAVEGSGAFALGQPLRLIAFPPRGDAFETPPLAEGRRRRAPDEAEVGVGLAKALGLRPGGTLAVALPGGEETRFRVVGLVRALENEGRVAYVRSGRLDRLGVLGEPSVAIALERGADPVAVGGRLRSIGVVPAQATAATTDNRGFLAVLATVLRVVAITVAFVCLVILAQALLITARERRPTLALLRTVGAGRAALAAVLAGACAVVLVPATVLGVVLEALVLGPAVASLAAGYAGLSLTPTVAQVVLAAGGLALVGAAAVAWVTRRVTAESVVSGLREEALP